jgi:predicted nucleotidyltransferase
MDKYKITAEDLEKRLKLKKPAQDIFCYGSWVYGTFNQNSDRDFIVITDEVSGQYSDNLLNVTFYTKEEFQQRIWNHEPSALETYFLPKEMILKKTNNYLFLLDKSKLRIQFSSKSSNSFVKCKKKLTIEKDYDPYVGKKSLFHSFRILMFGIQIAKFGRIVDYSQANPLLKEIMRINDWSELFRKYKSSYNNLSSDFRIVAPL